MSKKPGLQTPPPAEKRKKFGRKKIIIGAVIVLILLVIIILAVTSGGSSLPIVEAEPVARGNIVSAINTNGTVLSLQEKTYFSPVNAKISSSDLMVGQVVKRGDTLVSFETDTLERDNRRSALTADSTVNTNKDTLEKAEKTVADASKARGRVDELESEIDRYKAHINDLNTAISNRTKALVDKAGKEASDLSAKQKKTLTALQKALPSAVERDALLSENERLVAEVASLSVEKSKAEFDGDTATAELLQKQIDEKQTSVTENETEITSLTKKMGDYSEMSAEDINNEIAGLSTQSSASAADPSTDSRIMDLQQDLQSSETTLADLQGELAEEKAKVSAGEGAEISKAGRTALENQNNLAELESATAKELLALGRKGIHAEFPGIITKAGITQGADATQGMELVTVASNRDVAVEATVSKYDFSRLREGQKAEVVIGDNTYQGHVSVISKVAQLNDKNTPEITCRVQIDDPDDNVFLGVEAKVTITTATADNVLYVPIEAVNVTADGSFCDILEDGIVTRREITTGISSDTHIEVKSGLSENDQIITKLPIDVKEGTEAQIGDIEESADSDEE